MRFISCGSSPGQTMPRTHALRVPSDARSPSPPCLWLVLLVVFINMHTIGSRTGDFHPISSRPCRAYTRQSSRLVTLAADFVGLGTNDDMNINNEGGAYEPQRNRS